MENALIVTKSEKSAGLFSEILSAASIEKIVVAASCAEARRLLMERDFGIIVVNAPLPDETGEALSRHIAQQGYSQVILMVASEYFDAVSAVCEDDGVLTIAKPINKSVFWSALKLARAAQSRLTRAQAENRKLKQKIDDIRIIDRAKCLLISHLNMHENDAHKHIERQAMDMRITKREVAERILKTYGN